LQSGANGQFSFTGLRSGTYTVSLAATANCTTAVTTQTVNLAVGQAQVVNFTCTEAPPAADATVAIQSITAVAHPTIAAGAQVPANNVAGTVAVTVGISEGGHTVERLELLLGDEVIYTQQFTVGSV